MTQPSQCQYCREADFSEEDCTRGECMGQCSECDEVALENHPGNFDGYRGNRLVTDADPFRRDSTGQAIGFLENDPMGWEF